MTKTLKTKLSTFNTDDDSIDFNDLIGSSTALIAPAAATVAVVHGTSGNDNMVGTTGNDWIMGEDGNDTIQGGEGSDHLYGGNGKDLLKGGAGLDTLYGGAGNDVLDGGAAGDYMGGGTGDDYYIVDSIFDKVVEAANEGTDTVQTAFDLYTLDPNVERLEFFSSIAHIGNGNSGDNVITGASQNDVLRGMDGRDNLMGLAGNDTLEGGNGWDILWGGNGNDVLLGGTGDDEIYGESGDDRLDGGAGYDLLYGGAGADKFVFTNAEIGYGDHVSGFTRGQDKIDFSAIDGNAAVAGRQALAFAFQGAFVGGGVASVNYSFNSAGTVLHVDANGDGQGDFDVTISGQPFFVALSDLVL